MSSKLAAVTASLGPIGAGAVTGAMLAASGPPVDAAILAWIAFWPLLVSCRERRLGTRLLSGCIAGLVFGAGTVGPWLLPAARAHLAANAASAAALTLIAAWVYGGLYIVALTAIYPWLPRPRWLATAATWVLLEWVRGWAFGGAPWALLGHSQHDSLIAQIAELGGVPAVSFLVILPSAALAEKGGSRRWGIAASLVAVGAASSFGAARIWGLPPSEGEAGGVSVAVVSGQHLAENPVEAYAGATALASGADVIVWPEGAIPGYLQEEPPTRAAIAARAREHVGLLVGGRRYEGAGRARRFFNSVFLFDAQGEVVATADKQRLVPVAESSPLPWLHELPRPYSPAPESPVTIGAAELRLGPLICWDVLFDDLARSLVRQGVDLLVNVSSDRDLGAGGAQLIAFSRFRAIETRRWLVRASGTGKSLIVDPAGRVLERDSLRIAPDARRPLTFYVRHGELVPLAAALLLGLVALLDLAITRRVTGAGPQISARA